MKKLYRKEKVHPGGGPAEAAVVLRLLPAAILALTAALGAEDREVLAYLIIRSMSGGAAAAAAAGEGRRCRGGGGGGGGGVAAHRAVLDCGCFDCYTSFWSRWDCSPDRELIHQAVESFEDNLATAERGGGRGRSRSEKGRKGKKGKKVVKEHDEAAAVAVAALVCGDGFGGEEKAVKASEEEVVDDHQVEEKQEEESSDVAAGGGGGGGERRRGWQELIGIFWNLWGQAV